MPVHSRIFYRYILIACLLFAFKPASAQQNYHNLIFKIDSLAAVGLPKSALKEVSVLDAMARKDNNAPQMLRAVMYRLTFQTYLEDDALVNVINTLKTDIDRSVFPVKPVLQSVLADMYWSYYQQNRYKFAGRSRLDNPGTDFRTWDLATLTDETTRLYKLSLQDAQQEQNTSVGVFEGILKGDKSSRYLRPTLYDLLLHRAFDFFLAEEPAVTQPLIPFKIDGARYLGDSRTFAGLTIKTADTNSTVYQGVKFLQQATAFHLQKNNGPALADLDLKRLEFIYEKININEKDSLYISSLKHISSDTSAGRFRADALYKIAELYNRQDSLTMAVPYLLQALHDFPKSAGAVDSYDLLMQIRQKALSASIENINVPNKPILALLNYRNLSSARYRIYALSPVQTALLKKMDEHENQILPGEKTLAYIKRLKPVATETLQLHITTDYREHSTEFQIDGLKNGSYVLLLQQATAKDSLLQLTAFTVSNLSYLLRPTPKGQREIRVFNRETGELIKGAAVTIKPIPERYNKKQLLPQSVTGITNEQGLLYFKKLSDNYTITITHNNDRLEAATEYDYYNNDIQAPRKDSATVTLFFTDRAIYRPGQTIYFKALHTKQVDGKSSIITNAALTIKLKDVNAKELATVYLTTNEFGTAAGSFVIPQNILSGYARLTTVNGSTNIRVEEYKRPTFQVAIDPITQSYKLNDSVTVKGTVNAFSGYGLSDARVVVHVLRYPNIPLYNKQTRGSYTSNQRQDFTHREVARDTLKTDARGVFTYKFLALGNDGLNDKANYNFTITTDVTDAANETKSAFKQISLGASRVKLTVNIPEEIIAFNGADATATLYNTADERQDGKASVKIYALKQPGVFFKTRLWDAPDQWLMSKADYEKTFPGFAYRHEDEYSNWSRLQIIADAKIELKNTNDSKINLDKLLKSPPGVYAVVIEAGNAAGDTSSVTSYVTVIGNEAPIPTPDNWVTTVNTSVQSGKPAEFFVGIGKACNVLMETYEGPTLLSSRMLALTDGNSQKISVPVPATAQNSFAVQFMLVNDNRRYDYYQRILVADTVKPLNIRFLTMRDKLQPGEKEQWKLQISGMDNKASAEMVAGMYDASLDDILAAGRWQRIFTYPVYLPNYYQWSGTPLSASIQTIAYEDYSETPNDYDGDTHVRYEELDNLGFEYDGSYNRRFDSNQRTLSYVRQNASVYKKIAAQYKRSMSLAKNGFDVVGKILNYTGAMGGVKVAITNTTISTVSDPMGYFKIRVPDNATLTFSRKGWRTKKVKPVKGMKIYVRMLYPSDKTGLELEVVDPGYKSQYGDPNADIRVDEPVGNSDVKQVVEEDNHSYSGPEDVLKKTPSVAVKTRVNGKDFSPAAQRSLQNLGMMYDEVRSDKVVMREIRTTPIATRKNFAETAFFYPQLHTDDKGQIAIDFTIPESLTRWRFRAFAHTQKLQVGYIEQTIITQNKLMITANMPRFLREGDTITLSARVVNLSEDKLNGKAKLELLNALTLQPLNLFTKRGEDIQSFDLDTAATGAVSYKIIVPPGADAITYRITASAGNYTDGEENTLPVLPNSIAVTETMPMMVRAGQSKTFEFDKLISNTSATLQSKSLTLQYTQHPAWAAVQALPYLMEFPYECSEQVFSRYYANSFAQNIVNKYPKIKQVFDRWNSADSKALLSNLEKNQELKSILLEETPWLRDAADETEQKKHIALLFDLNKMTYELDQNLTKLQQKQLPQGGFPWFGGNTADRYITQHIVAGIGQLTKLKITGNNTTLNQIGSKALAYVDNQLVTDEADRKKYDKKYQSRNLDALEIHAWYARSFYPDAAINGELKEVQKNYVSRALSQWVSRSEFEKAMIALTLFRMGDKTTTGMIQKSLLETARQLDELGMYWPDNQSGYYWYQSPVETQSLMIELFTEAGENNTAVNEMKIWLMRNKQTNNWRTTKATAAACYALLVKGSDVLDDVTPVAITLGGKPLAELKPDIKAEAGSGYLKTSWAAEQIKPALGHVQVTNSSKIINWGAMYWQYTERMDKVTPSNTNVQLTRKYYIQTQKDNGPVLVAVDATHLPKTGDVLKVVINLKADRDFDYVHLKDLRPAGTEPMDALSGYKHQDGLSYYQESKDVATNFFISTLGKGTYVFEYQLRVVQPGNYATGVTSLQSMYAPEFSAHSDGGRITFKAK